MFHENTALTVGRAGQAVGENEPWNLIHVTDKISDTNLFYRGGAHIFPLYQYPEGMFANSVKKIERTTNFKPSFRRFIDDRYNKNIKDEVIFGYIFGICNSICYRAKYEEFLKIDFPRVPFSKDLERLIQISKVGWELMNVHLLKVNISYKEYPFGAYIGEGLNNVQNRNFLINPHNNEIGKLYINQKQYFNDVPVNIWNFYIGGYQVIDKYLKDRVGRQLNLEEIEHIEEIIRIICLILIYSILFLVVGCQCYHPCS